MQSDLFPPQPWILPLAGGQHVDGARSDTWLIDRVCAPRLEVRAELTKRAFIFRDKPHRTVLRDILGDASRLLAHVPSLEKAVQAAVAEVVLLKAQPAFDISHSEPRWPQTIFISTPYRRGEVSALRAVENVVHEAMHLQLTILEQSRPLVADRSDQIASPWREEIRSLQGVLHGLYVFRCISAFFANLDSLDVLGTEGFGYVTGRRGQIAQEISRLDFDRLAGGMTTEGLSLLIALAKEHVTLVSTANTSPGYPKYTI